MGQRAVFLFWIIVAYGLRYCETKAPEDHQSRAQLPEHLADVDFESLEASEEDVAALKSVFKRLAPEKNVFFGNEDMLKEWLSGAGVNGQPGVDFPMLTSIPKTSFSCRGLKGGYYADLDTNCQVFHICDNGRKISFLCPNGTIFQQSQLICDWWFKVDCSKSADLYEQSAEQLAEDERKRADAKRMNSEFRRPSNDNGKYYRTNYDGKQNGRMNPYGQASKNQLPGAEQRPETKSTTRSYDPNQIYSQQSSRGGTQLSQINDLAQNGASDSPQDAEDPETPAETGHQQANPSRGNYQAVERQRNGLVDRTATKQSNYDQRLSSKYSAQEANALSASQRSGKSRTREDGDNSLNRVTPFYTEATTFRTSTPAPIKEVQQLAESAAFARGNRFSKIYNSNSYSTYQSANNAVTTATTRKATSTTAKSRISSPQQLLKPKKELPAFHHQTYAPIFKPRTTTYPPTTTTYTTVNYDRERSTVANFDQTTPYPTDGQFHDSGDLGFIDDTRSTRDEVSVTPTPFPEQSYSTIYHERPAQNGGRDATAYQERYYQDGSTLPPTTAQNYGNSETYGEEASTSDVRNVQTTTGNRFSTTPPPTTRAEPRVHSSTGKFTINVTPDQNLLSSTTKSQDTRNGGKTRGRSSMRSWHNYRQNLLSTTEKPQRATSSSGNFNQQKYEKSVSPYSASYRTKPTLGPYVPFTRNYVYTTSTSTSTTTPRPAVYTATVPIYVSTATTQSESVRTAAPSQNDAPVVSAATTASARGAPAYLPEPKPVSPGKPANRGVPEAREHALSMLKSLRGLEGTVPTIIGNKYSNRSGLTIPHSSSPATLHSLALYFATSLDEFNNSTENSAREIQAMEKSAKLLQNTTAELPTSILTQHTINSYTDLFNLNNALEGNATESGGLEEEAEEEEDEDISDDLDLQQSQGPLAAAKKSNNTKLRELAQVFTHALSAYLQDPETFKKILTEIRPTEPSSTVDDVTVSVPTTPDDYPSVTKEQDEVLDFSDDVGRRSTTNAPYSTEEGGFGYYTTSIPSETVYPTTTDSPYDGQDYLTPPTSLPHNFASQVNKAFDLTSGNNIQGPSGPSSNDADYDSYYISAPASAQRNGTTFEPYGKNVKPTNSQPINENYVPSSTLASFEETHPPEAFDRPKNSVNQVSDNSLFSGSTPEPSASTTKPFTIRYFDSTTPRAETKSQESLVTASSVYSLGNTHGKRFESRGEPPVGPSTVTEPCPTEKGGEGGDKTNDHWTSSPTVTQLWENTVFVDPKRINQGLTSEAVSFESSEGSAVTTRSSKEVLTTASSEAALGNKNPSSPWQWTTLNSNDAPTAFTLLPTYSSEFTATPSPVYTSITTTITSSITSTSSLPQEVKSVANETDNEIVRAKEMFGGLNDTSSSTLMKVMKQADKNDTVRQLVLLLISHCKGPMNKTQEQEKQALLNALLKMPVNEFSSEESRELVLGINKVHLSIEQPVEDLQSKASSYPVVEATSPGPVITTFRTKKRRVKSKNPKTTTLRPSTAGISGSRESAKASDERAIELLRSLYSVAAKFSSVDN